MMHGYGWSDMMTSPWSFLGASGWMVVPMMGIGLLVVVALVAWIVWMQRESLGLAGPHTGGGYPSSVESYGDPTLSAPPPEDVEQIARRRFASGEIDEAEFEAIITTLREQR